jgi:hypothetical protein
VLLVSPTVWGWVPAGAGWRGVADQVAIIWLAVAVGALLVRIAQLFVIANVQTGLVWGTKILTDPFHDVALYHRAPLYVLRGERFDPIVPHSAR